MCGPDDAPPYDRPGVTDTTHGDPDEDAPAVANPDGTPTAATVAMLAGTGRDPVAFALAAGRPAYALPAFAINGSARRALERDLARHERWLAGDWDSRSSRGIAAADRHKAERDRIRAELARPRGA